MSTPADHIHLYKQQVMYVCWRGGSTETDRKRLYRLVKRASSVLASPLDSTEEVAERRMLAKLMSVMDKTSHPLHETVEAPSRSFSLGILCGYFTHTCMLLSFPLYFIYV